MSIQHEPRYEKFEEHQELLGELAEPLEEQTETLEEQVDALMQKCEFSDYQVFYDHLDQLEEADPEPSIPNMLDETDLPDGYSHQQEPVDRVEYRNQEYLTDVENHQRFTVVKEADVFVNGEKAGRATVVRDKDIRRR